MQAAPGADTWVIGDRADGKPMAFTLKVEKDAILFDSSEYARTHLDPNVWYHVELYVNYESSDVCVEGILYDSAGKEVRVWRRQPALSMRERKQLPVGCDEFFVQGNAVSGERALRIDNLYIGIVSPQ